MGSDIKFTCAAETGHCSLRVFLQEFKSNFVVNDHKKKKTLCNLVARSTVSWKSTNFARDRDTHE